MSDQRHTPGRWRWLMLGGEWHLVTDGPARPVVLTTLSPATGFQDSEDLMLKAIDYLKRAKGLR